METYGSPGIGTINTPSSLVCCRYIKLIIRSQSLMCSLRSVGDLKRVKCVLPNLNGQDFYLFVNNVFALLGCWLVLIGRPCLKCDGTCAETRFGLSFGRNGRVHLNRWRWGGGGLQFSRLLAAELCAIGGSNAGYTMFRGSVKGTGYPLRSPVSPSLPFPCVTVCHHISIWL